MESGPGTGLGDNRDRDANPEWNTAYLPDKGPFLKKSEGSVRGKGA